MKSMNEIVNASNMSAATTETTAVRSKSAILHEAKTNDKGGTNGACTGAIWLSTACGCWTVDSSVETASAGST